MISAQTHFAFVARENRFPLCANAALRVRIMLYATAVWVFRSEMVLGSIAWLQCHQRMNASREPHQSHPLYPHPA
jgi:hypothetical protein